MELLNQDFSECTIASLLENGIITENDVSVVKKLGIKNKVCNIHNYKIAQGKGKDTRWFTYVTDPKTHKAKKVAARTEDDLFEKLYLFYFTEPEEEEQKCVSLRQAYPE